MVSTLIQGRMDPILYHHARISRMNHFLRRPMKERIFHILLRIFGITWLSIAVFDKNFDYWFDIQEYGTRSWLICLAIHLAIFMGGMAIFLLDRYLSRRPESDPYINSFTVNGLLVLTSIMTPVTFCELLLRNVTYAVNKDVSLFQKDKLLGWRLKPNAASNPDAPVRVNRHGLRGPDREYRKREGVTRILFLGDSIPYGLRLPYDDTFPRRVEILMNQERDRPVECINAGIPGYSTWQEYQFFENEAYRYNPDIVVLSFCLNDVLHTYTGLHFGDYGVDDPVPYIEENWIDYITHRSAIVLVGKSIYHRIRFGKTLKENAIYREGLDVAALFEKETYPEIKQAWSDTQYYIQKIADRCEREKARLILILFPYIYIMPTDERTVFSPKPMAEYSRRKGIPVIEVWPLIEQDMKEQGIQKLNHYFQDHCHPTADGNRLVAESIVRCLKSLTSSPPNRIMESTLRTGD